MYDSNRFSMRVIVIDSAQDGDNGLSKGVVITTGRGMVRTCIK